MNTDLSSMTGRNAPPARHTLESDSEEEQDPEDVHTSRTTSSIKLRRPAPDVKIQLTSDCPALAGEHLIIANSEAGMAWSQGLDASSLSLDGFLLVDGQKVIRDLNTWRKAEADDVYLS